ncbi:benzoate/H(+) symporter BenE family transporter [Roseibium aestuarii]|uniref:Benzoate/H(+) symporter BenE family transporter n=1 Tax=Roseibium aestuarii TaxID=2600299 RepID=A0ABW4JST2_9HYPH|nr:benzoate/H(+) symporter BenE family transporter [Roseibium aestuarii]
MIARSTSPLPSAQNLSTGLLVGLVGTGSSFAVVVQGLLAVGASEAQAASGMMALCLSLGLMAIVASWMTRMPISTAWSTPGAALLAASGALEGGFNAAVGAFILSSALLLLAGLFKPLTRLVARIPAALANAMLAGILMGLCLAPVKAIPDHPVEALTIIAVWAVTLRVKRLLAVPLAVLVTLAFIAFEADGSRLQGLTLFTPPVFVTPEFTWSAAVGLALPLFIVTMASQNIPGMAVLAVNGYHPDGGRLFSLSGLFSLLSAPFGGHAVNLAAITAAMAAGEDADPDPALRYRVCLVTGVYYLVFGALAGAATVFITLVPPVLIQAVAGLALIGPLANATMAATRENDTREAAIVTFLVTVSGVSFFQIGGAFWGLIAGGAFLALMRFRRAEPA